MAQFDISIQPPTGARWGVVSGSVSATGAWELPLVPQPRLWDPSSVADVSPQLAGWRATTAEEGLPSYAIVPLRAVLSAWRGVERELHQAAVGSPQWQRLSAVRACLRDTHHEMFDRLRRRSTY